MINEENFKRIVYPLPVSNLLFVGKKTEEQLLRIGIRTIGELATASEQMLTTRFGKAGYMLHKYALGLDDAPVTVPSYDDAKSISNGLTFRHNLVGWEQCRLGIEFLSDEIGMRLRQKGLKCSTVQLTIKDEYLRLVQRQRQLQSVTDISSEIAECAFLILKDEWTPYKPVRMLTVSAQNLLHSDTETSQLSLFDTDDDEKRIKKKNAEIAVDKIRQKYGKDAMIKGAVLGSDIGIFSAPKKNKD